MVKNNVQQLSDENPIIIRWIIGIAVAIPLVVAILLFMPAKFNWQSNWVYFLPHLNAAINSTTSVLLLLGLAFIKSKNIQWHRTAMTSAMVCGALFLVSYVIYHASAESTPYGGEGWIRPVYYFILISHILLAAFALFPILLAFYYGYTDQRAKHLKVVKYAFPIWLYVSITGVVVYFMIKPYYIY
jgi:putative membrane protein